MMKRVENLTAERDRLRIEGDEQHARLVLINAAVESWINTAKTERELAGEILDILNPHPMSDEYRCHEAYTHACATAVKEKRPYPNLVQFSIEWARKEMAAK